MASNPLIGSKYESEADNLSLYVSNLSYTPARTLGRVVGEQVLKYLPYWEFPAWQRLTSNYMKPFTSGQPWHHQGRNSVSPLYNISFAAEAGKITALLSTNYGERRSIIDLVAGRRKRGTYDGDIRLCGSHIHPNSSISLNTAFVPRNSLYIPGLTYLELLQYSARLRMCAFSDGSRAVMNEEDINTRCKEVLQLLHIYHKRYSVLPDEPPSRGVEAGELRRLSIAVELVNFPALLIVDDPAMDLEPAVALTIYTALRRIAERDTIVLLGITRPSPMMLSHIDKLVVVAKGYSIYASAPQNLKSFFCSRALGYTMNVGDDIVDFVMDIGQGYLRPNGYRQAEENSVLQEKFIQSPFAHDTRSIRHNIENALVSVSPFDGKYFRCLGYAYFDTAGVLYERIKIVCSRAVKVKFREKDIIRKSIGSSIFVGLVIGYFQFQVGAYGHYTMNLLKFPYVNTSNVTGLLFFLGAFIFTQQVLNVQLICRKISMFRQEQASGYCAAAAFAIATILSELPFAIFYTQLFSNILYAMSALGSYDSDTYGFFCTNVTFVAIIGFLTAFSYAVLFRYEIFVRDMFLLTVFLQLMLSGFPFQLSFITSYMKDISKANPMRWVYESLMVWKFNSGNYEDGQAYLEPFCFDKFDKYSSFAHYQTFIYCSIAITGVLLLPLPMLLRKHHETTLLMDIFHQMTCNRFKKTLNPHDVEYDSDDSMDSVEKKAWMDDEEAVKILAKEGLHAERGLSRNLSRSGSFSQVMSGSNSFSGLSEAGDPHAAPGSPQHAAHGYMHDNNTNIPPSPRASITGLANNAEFDGTRPGELQKPVIFARESSTTGSRLSISINAMKSQSENGHRSDTRDALGLITLNKGPTVSFYSLCYSTTVLTSSTPSAYPQGRLSGVEGSMSSTVHRTTSLGTPIPPKLTIPRENSSASHNDSTTSIGNPLHGGDSLDPSKDNGRASGASRSSMSSTIYHGRSLAVLDNVSGQFDWGKLSCILGAPGSGKTTLLHVLAGDTRSLKNIRGSGHIFFDEHPMHMLEGSRGSRPSPLWKRCALVYKEDVHHGDLTVKETIEYALQLRCNGFIAHKLLDENVSRTLDVLHLGEESEKRLSKCTRGVIRRTSIAEEIVHGPTLLLIDEPTSNLSVYDASVLMRTFREMVNNDRTVVTTMHQPNVQEFALYDNVLLLSSKGSVIYHGSPQNAIGYFTQKPCNYSFAKYNNVAAFLLDIASLHLKNLKEGNSVSNSNNNSNNTSPRMSRVDAMNAAAITPTGDKGNISDHEFLKHSYEESDYYKLLIERLRRLVRCAASNAGRDGSFTVTHGDGNSNRSSIDSQRDTFSASHSINSLTRPSRVDALTGATANYGKYGKGGDVEADISRDSDFGYTPQGYPAGGYRETDHYGRTNTSEWNYISCECIYAYLVVGVDRVFGNSEMREVFLLHLYIIFRRSWNALWSRSALFWGGIATQMLLGLLIGWILGNASDSIYNTISFFVVGALLLMLSNIQIINYLYATNQVFLKEANRGLYHVLSYWLVSSIPIYINRMIGTIFYSLITYGMLGYANNTETQFYFIYCNVLSVMAGTSLAEMIIVGAPSMRAAYISVPVVSFIQFLFSGLMLKPCLLPRWIAAWAPSVSIIRWTLQGEFINQFKDNALFPELPGYSSYDGFLTLYGWGGKDKWYCSDMIWIFIVVFRVGSLMVHTLKSKQVSWYKGSETESDRKMDY
jgi:ABC-type multidrug transport system ATPase subunit